MADAGKIVDKLRSELASKSDQLKPAPSRRGLYVFLSYDLVDSTRYKSLERTQWPLVTKQFYEFIEDGIRKRISKFRLWKYVGDELLLYKRIRDSAELREILPNAFDVLNKTISKIHSAFPSTRTILSIKATAWCADVDDLPPQDLKSAESTLKALPSPNIIVGKDSNSGKHQVDFLGPDIDVGFRISKFAIRKRLVVSADLAYLLYRDRSDNEKIESKLKIVGYESLKGVWDGRRYPIIWYEEDWTNTAKSFLYDERFTYDVVGRIVGGEHGESIDRLAKVYEDLDKKAVVENIHADLASAELSAAVGEEPASVPQSGFVDAVEIHCAAICFDNEGRVLIAKRPANKRRFPDHWEFGCGQLRANESFEECLKRNYKEDFNAELRFEENLTPVATYLIEDAAEGRRIPGLIFVAEVLNANEVIAGKHGEIEWVSIRDVDRIKENKLVPNLVENIRSAAAVWNARDGRNPAN